MAPDRSPGESRTAAGRPWLGIGYMVASALAGSTTGILVRLVDQPSEWQILCYRSLAFAALFLIILAAAYGRGLPAAFRRIGWVGSVGAVCLGLTYIAYLTSMFLTSIAAAVIAFSVAPFFAGAIGALVLGERPHPTSWIWMTLALSGVAVMMAFGMAPSAAFDRPLLGTVVALSAAMGYAIAVSMLRAKRRIDMRPAFVAAGLVAFAIAAAFAGSLAVSLRDALIGVTLGVVSLGLQYLFLQRAARHLQAEEITLLALLEAIASPVWVWIGVGEVPRPSTLLGGVLVIAAVVALSLSTRRRRRPD